MLGENLPFAIKGEGTEEDCVVSPLRRVLLEAFCAELWDPGSAPRPPAPRPPAPIKAI